MKFIHEDQEFEDLIRIVARDLRINVGLVEKDYWVTHSLWALSKTRLEFWFKGGTSLSKGFGLIQRFSEDLDLRIEHGSEEKLPPVKNWKSLNKGPVAERKAFYEALEKFIKVPNATIKLRRESMDADVEEADYEVRYPGKFLKDLPSVLRPFVLLEVGNARVTPFVVRSLSSFVHDWLEKNKRLDEFLDNRPTGVRCVHPMVTLLEKIDAIIRRFPRETEPETFIRHYEDAARIIEAEKQLPKLEMNVADLVSDMVSQKQIKGLPVDDHPAFLLKAGGWGAELEKAYRAIDLMYWEKRMPLDEACKTIRRWLKANRIQ